MEIMEGEDGKNIQSKNLGVNLSSSFALRSESDLLDAVLYAMLLFAGDIHYVEGQEFAGYFGEGDVEMDFHSFACCCCDSSPAWSACVSSCLSVCPSLFMFMSCRC